MYVSCVFCKNSQVFGKGKEVIIKFRTRYVKLERRNGQCESRIIGIVKQARGKLTRTETCFAETNEQSQ